MGNCVLNVSCKQNSRSLPVVLFVGGPGMALDQRVAETLAQNDTFAVVLQPGLETDRPIRSTITTYLNDIQVAIEWLCAADFELSKEADVADITIAGMDRGGMAAIIQGIEDQRVRQVVALSPLIDPMHHVQPHGENLLVRAATGEQIQSTFMIEEDFKQNLTRLSLQSNLAKYDKPLYIFHGSEEDEQDMNDLETVYSFVGHAVMIPVENAGHSLNWSNDELSETWVDLLEEIAEIASI